MIETGPTPDILELMAGTTAIHLPRSDSKNAM